MEHCARAAIEAVYSNKQGTNNGNMDVIRAGYRILHLNMLAEKVRKPWLNHQGLHRRASDAEAPPAQRVHRLKKDPLVGSYFSTEFWRTTPVFASMPTSWVTFPTLMSNE